MPSETQPAHAAPAPFPIDAEAQGLPPTQATAINALVTGCTVTAAAARAGVSRSTLHEWLRSNLEFRAALNRARREYQQAAVCRLEALVLDAAECVAGAVRDGNVKTSLELLKRLNVLAPQIGSDDAEELKLLEEEKVSDRRLRRRFAKD